MPPPVCIAADTVLTGNHSTGCHLYPESASAAAQHVDHVGTDCWQLVQFIGVTGWQSRAVGLRVAVQFECSAVVGCFVFSAARGL
jgi:hypothetical protein